MSNSYYFYFCATVQWIVLYILEHSHRTCIRCIIPYSWFSIDWKCEQMLLVLFSNLDVTNGTGITSYRVDHMLLLHMPERTDNDCYDESRRFYYGKMSHGKVYCNCSATLVYHLRGCASCACATVRKWTTAFCLLRISECVWFSCLRQHWRTYAFTLWDKMFVLPVLYGIWSAIEVERLKAINVIGAGANNDTFCADRWKIK